MGVWGRQVPEVRRQLPPEELEPKRSASSGTPSMLFGSCVALGGRDERVPHSSVPFHHNTRADPGMSPLANITSTKDAA